MKQVLLASILAAAVASVATFLLTEALRPPVAPPAPDPAVAALRSTLEETRRELAALRPPAAPVTAGAEPALEAPAVVDAEGASGKPTGPGFGVVIQQEGEVQMFEAVERPDEPSAISRSADIVQKIRGLSDWDDSADLRSRWILMPEESVLREFGKPDEIYLQENGAENWGYRVPMGTTDEDGNAEWNEFTLTLNRGRLIRADD